MADKLIIDWKQYNLIVEKLAIQIHKSGYKPDLLIGIARGGLPITDVLSRIFKLKCAYLAVESYSGKGIEDQQGVVRQSISYIRFLTTFLDYVMQLVTELDGISCGYNHTLRLRIVDLMEVPGGKRQFKQQVALATFWDKNDQSKDGRVGMANVHYNRSKPKSQALEDAASLLGHGDWAFI